MVLKALSVIVPIFFLASNLHASDWQGSGGAKISGPIQIAETKNYCKDPASWKKWNDLIAKYPKDLDVQTLHALRLGLCTKIEHGSITLNDAIDLFDRAQQMVIDKKFYEKEKLKGGL
jgi:hypothetical protein